MPLDIINRDNVTDNATLNLNGASAVTAAEVNGIAYLFVAGVNDSGISVFAIEADGTLTNVANVTDDATLNLLDVQSVTTAVVGGTTYLVAAGGADAGLSVFAVGADGSLTNVANVADDATLNLASAISVAGAEIGGVSYVFAAGPFEGLSAFRIGADGSLTNVANVADDATLPLRGVTSVTTAVVGGTTYLFAAGQLDGGLSVFAVGADGSLANVANVTDDATLELQGASNVTTAAVGGTTYLFAAGSLDDGLSVFAVGNDGSLTNIANVTDSAALNLDGAFSITTAVVGGVTYLLAAGLSDNGVSVFAVGADGSLTNVANIADDASLQLGLVHGLAAAMAGGSNYLFAAGSGDDGVSVFELATDDTLIGTSGADTLDGLGGADLIVGLGGNDVLDAGTGNDTITGGDGDDTLTGGAGDDIISGDNGTDTAAYSGNQADYRVTDLGLGRFEVADLRANAPEGTDTLDGVERLTFADGTVSLTGTPNQAPTAMAISHDAIAENSTAGALVGALSATDPDTGETFTYQFLDDAGGRFALNGNLIEVAGGLDFETASSHQIVVRVTDAGGLSYDRTLTIRVTDAIEAATDAPTQTRSIEAGSTEALLGLTASPPPAGAAHSFTVAGLPARGAVFLQGVAVEAGQVLTEAQFQALTYSSPETTREETLRLSVSDGTNATPLTVKLVVAAPVDGVFTGSGSDDRLDGAGGNDIIDGKAGKDTLIGGSGGDRLFGQAGNDLLSGGDNNDRLRGAAGKDDLSGQAGNDNLKGGGGVDRLAGDGGADRLFGGGGADTFVFMDVGDSTVAARGRDTIADFSQRKGDKIDLTAIDATTGAAGDDAFVFIGRDRFSHEAGELRYGRSSGDTFVYGDTDGDGTADFAIKVEGVIDLAKEDFML